MSKLIEIVNLIKDEGYEITEKLDPKVIDFSKKMIISVGIYNNLKTFVPYEEVEPFLKKLSGKCLPTFCELYDSSKHKKIKFIADMDYIDEDNIFFINSKHEEYMNIIKTRLGPLFNKISIASSNGYYMAPLKAGDKNVIKHSENSASYEITTNLSNNNHIKKYIKMMEYDKEPKFIRMVKKHSTYVDRLKDTNFIKEESQEKIIKIRRDIMNYWNRYHGVKCKKVYKYSYHIVADLYFESMYSMKAFVIKNKLDDILDMNIYSIVRKMRLPLCAKGYNYKTHNMDNRVMNIEKGEINDFFITYPKLNIDMYIASTREEFVSEMKFLEFLSKSNNFKEYNYNIEIDKINNKFIEFMNSNNTKLYNFNYKILRVAFSIWTIATKYNFVFDKYFNHYGYKIEEIDNGIELKKNY